MRYKDGYFDFNVFGKECLLSFKNDWAQIFGHWNWYNFTLIDIEAENDKMLGGYEFDFVVLGLGIHFRINWKETEEMKKLIELADKIKK